MSLGFVEHSAIVGGWPAQVIDTLMSRYLPKYLAAMTPEERAEMDRAHRVMARAAKAYRAGQLCDVPSSDIGPSEPAPSDLAQDLSHDDEIGTAEAAEMLDVGQRQVVKLAPVWEGQGLARRVGRTWLVDRVAVEVYRDRPERRSA
jgi:hypothetical protein